MADERAATITGRVDAALPQPSSAVERAMTPDPSATPEPRATSEPRATPEPSATPKRAPPTAHGPTGLRDVIETIGLVAPPLTLLAGLMFYFGWLRTRHYWEVFGLEHSLLGLSVQDYLLRGIDAVHLPLVVIAVTVVGSVWAWKSWTSWEGRNRHRATLATVRWAVLAVGAGLLAAGAVLAAGSPTAWPPLPSWTLAAGLVAVAAAELLRTDLARTRPESAGGPQHAGSPAVVVAAVATLLMLALFWVFADYAADVGRVRAERRADGLNGRATVVLYSPHDLHIDAPGVRTERLPTDGPYRYRYSGLTLILHTDGKYVLLPSAWKEGASSIVVPVSDAPRVDFAAGGAPDGG